MTAPATPLGAHGRAYVIAEAGVNHNGSIEMARALVDVAADAGADAIKFQTFSTDRLVTAQAPKAAYQAAATGAEESQYELIRRLELDRPAHFDLATRCLERGLQFLSTPFDEMSLDFLVDEIGLQTVKIASGEITNGPFLLHAARRAGRIILSTGMSTMAEVEAAVAVLAFGMLNKSGNPKGRNWSKMILQEDTAQAALRERLILLHCTSEYPAPVSDINLRALDSLRETFGVDVGLSDHSEGIAVAIAAVARGASVVEKHFTLDCSLPGPDHCASLNGVELKAMIEGIRAVELALGDGIKRPAESELKNRPVVRKSLVAARAIRAGERFDAASLAAKRVGSGRSPMELWDLIGLAAQRDYGPDDVI